MNDPAAQASPPPETPPTQPLPAQAPATFAPQEDTWLVVYSGTDPLAKGGYTWLPDQAQRVPESVARAIIGSDNLRKVDDEDVFNAQRARAANPPPTP